AAAVGYKMHQDLGAWLKCQMKKGIKAQGSMAEEVLASCDVPVPELQSQWAKEWEAQLLIQAHAPARLRKELDSVLALQADFDASEHAPQTAHTDISGRTLKVLDSMEGSHAQLLNKLETLYASLNVQDKFPKLDSVQLDFVQILLMARDLKINIHKQVVGSFFEWDKLD
ncbi:hypothetical protein PISMIDRAFT_115413, partial [Pisolithus microcarpus 441]